MTNDPRLERYLTTLEQALKPFPISDRAEIITEIKSHVLSALDRDPQARMDTILNALGEPETVANRYLMERGLKPIKTSIHPIVKWLTIGFLGTFALILFFVGYVATHSGSLIKVDGKNRKVQILGGLIDVDGGKNNISFAGLDESDFHISGIEVLNKNQTVNIKFSNGKMDIQTAAGNEFSWSCMGSDEADKNLIFNNQNSSLDLTSMKSLRCQLKIPADTHLVIQGAVGKISFVKPHFDISADLDVGKIFFQSAENTTYKFDVSVNTGKSDQFESSIENKAHSIKMHVSTGKIEKDK